MTQRGLVKASAVQPCQYSQGVMAPCRRRLYHEHGTGRASAEILAAGRFHLCSVPGGIGISLITSARTTSAMNTNPAFE